jgi:hypothetical protein
LIEQSRILKLSNLKKREEEQVEEIVVVDTQV